MSDFQQKDGSGALFKPKQPKKSDKSPDYTGSITVGGKKHSLAAWIKKSKKGDTYMSLSIGEWKEKSRDEFQDDSGIPF